MPDDQSEVTKTAPSNSRSGPVAKKGMDAPLPDTGLWGQAYSALLGRTINAASATYAFSLSRLQANMGAAKAIMACGDTAELIGLQEAYIANTVEQYRDYTRELAVEVMKSPSA
ncbi:MAG: phasin family protein [Sulfitobacter sp.]